MLPILSRKKQAESLEVLAFCLNTEGRYLYARGHAQVFDSEPWHFP